MGRMNATTSLPSSRRTVLEPGGGSRRWLTLLLAVEGLVALAAALTFVAVAPDARVVLPALGTTGGFALLLLGLVCAVVSVMAFTTASAVLRRRAGAAASASALQACLAVTAGFAGLVNGFDQEIVAAAMLAGIGLVLAILAGRAQRSPRIA